MMKPILKRQCLYLLTSVFLLASCTPKIEVIVPDKPITINLNVKIEHEIRIKVDKELESAFSSNPGLF